MKNLALFLVISSSICCLGQEKLPPPDTTFREVDSIVVENEIIIGQCDPEAQFPGGVQALRKYIHEDFDWDCVFANDSVIEFSKVYLSFMVEVDGTISDVSVDRDINEDYDQCWADFIKNMPKWNPAIDEHGKPIAQRVRLPININLD